MKANHTPCKCTKALSIRALAWVCGLLLSFFSAAWAMAPAGAVLENTAVAEYYSPELKQNLQFLSNTVSVKVSGVVSASLSAGRTLSLPIYAQFTQAHIITNTGNVPYAFTLRAQNVGSDDFDFNVLQIYIDLNQDGLVNGSDYLLAADGRLPELAMGEQLHLVFVTIVPDKIPEGKQGQVKLTLQDDDAQLNLQAINTVIVVEDGILRLTKTASASYIQPNGELTFYLRGSNTSQTPVPPVNMSIDGVLQQKVLVADAIPVNTVFDSVVQIPPQAQVVYHHAGDALMSYRSTPPSDLRFLDKIGFAFPLIAPLETVNVGFKVRASAVYAGDLSNIAQVYQRYNGDREAVFDSNRVSVQVEQPIDAQLHFYQNNQYQQIASLTYTGRPLLLRAAAALCNRNASVVERFPVMLSVTKSQDRESGFEAIETAPNSGIFELQPVNTAHWPTTPVATNNSVIEAGFNDMINAQLVCHGLSLKTDILIDPAGIVFDSYSNRPIAGATVELLGVNPDGSTFVPEVFAEDGITRESNIDVTGEDGLYHFPLVRVGEYRLRITPPAQYAYPTEIPLTVLSSRFPERRLDDDGSKGGVFPVTIEGPVYIDVPMDPDQIQGLLIDKAVSTKTAQIGDILTYTLTLRNNNASFDLTSAHVQDTLPVGLAYMIGSSQLTIGTVKTQLADPVDATGQATQGPQLKFVLPNPLTANTQATLTYRVKVRAGVPFGRAVNSAQLLGNEGSSNIAQAAVDVQGGVLGDDAYLFGKVFLDCNQNRQQDEAELGVPAVRIYMEDGTFIVTDGEGKYSLYGLNSRTHVLKVDDTTLPRGAELQIQDSRNALRAKSRFVDVKNGEWHRGDFPVACTPEVVAQVQARRGKANTDKAFTQTLEAAKDRTLDPVNLGDLKARPAEGLVTAKGQLKQEAADGLSLIPTPKADVLFQQSVQGFNKVTRPVSPVVSLDMDALIADVDSALDFLELKEGDRLAADTLSVRVKGLNATQLVLSVNGQIVDEKRVGRVTALASKNVQVWEYIGVKLLAGKNTLTVQQQDGFGVMRGEKTITVWAPGALTTLSIDAPDGKFVADGITPVPVIVRLSDADGSLVTAKTLLTLESSAGRWDVKDINPAEPNIQTFIEGGEAIFDLIPPAQAGQVELHIASGVIERKQQLQLVPDLRPMIAVGLIEGAVRLSGSGKVEALSATDSFEQEIKQLSYDNGKAGVRGAFYIKGKVRGDYLLTMAYDSDKDTQTRLFRDIQPDQFYPVYGDSAERGFDAQSTSKLFVRVDKGRSWMMYGDYSTSEKSSSLPLATLPTKQLGNYSRSLTGLRGHLQYDRVAINYFAAYDSTQQKVVNLPAQGLSIYQVNLDGMQEGSEKVEIITLDKNQTSVELNRSHKTRLQDYMLNLFTGSLSFSEVIPSFDVNGNPNIIRVTYEVDQGGDNYWVSGFDADIQIADAVIAGVSTVIDQNPTQEKRIYSARMGVKIDDKNQFVAEVAASDSAGQTELGRAARAEYRYEAQKTRARVFAQYATKGFDNPNAGVTPNKVDMGAQVSTSLTDTTQASIEATRSQDKSTTALQQQVLVAVDQKIGQQLTARAGVRYQEDKAADGARDEITSLALKLTWQPKWWPKANAFFEYEQDIADASRRIIALGGEAYVANRARIYARHAFSQTLNVSSNTGGNLIDRQTIYGVDYAYMDNGKLYTEYALKDAINQEDAAIKFGVRQTWLWAPGYGSSASFERIKPLGQSTTQASTSASWGLEMTASQTWKAGGRLEWEQTPSTTTWYNTLAAARKLDKNWTLLGSNAYRLRSDRIKGDDHLENSFKLGFAYRPITHNRLNALMRYEWLLDDKEANEVARSLSHIISAHANYQMMPAWVLNGRYALRLSRVNASGQANRSTTQLLYLRNTYDINDRFNTSLAGATRFGGGSEATMWGAELGMIVSPEVWLSLGYNFEGFADDALKADEYTAKGFYMRLRMKFDENSLRWLQ